MLFEFIDNFRKGPLTGSDSLVSFFEHLARFFASQGCVKHFQRIPG